MSTPSDVTKWPAVVVDDPAKWGSPHTLSISQVTADAVYVRRDPPWPGWWRIHSRLTPVQLPARPAQGYDRPSMELVLGNMCRNDHPALEMYRAAYAQMLALAAK